MPNNTPLAGICVAVLLCCISAASFAQIKSDFTSSDESWTVEVFGSPGTNTAPTYNASGGNPGGYLSFSITGNGSAGWDWKAPAKFRGNLGSAYGRNLTFDLQQSVAGTDNTNGDVIIVGTAGTIYYQLPTKPATGSWSSYSIPFQEAQWHNGCPSCAAPTSVNMKAILANVTDVRIRAKYSTTVAAYTALLDNVVLSVLTFGNGPTVTSFTPLQGTPGTTVTINGTGFDGSPSGNTVYFGAIKATVTAASATQLTVTVPPHASYGPISVINNTSGLQCRTAINFSPLYDNNLDFGGEMIRASMTKGSSAILPMGNNSNSFGNMDKGDLDGDGWTDLVVTETGTAKLFLYQNLGSGSALSSASFSSAITLPSLSTILGGPTAYLSEVLIVDVDNDGKLDIAASTASNYGAGTGFLAVFRNISTGPGTLTSASFANPVFFPYAYYSALVMAAGDLDGDGRVDFAFTTGTSPGNMFICQNFSTPGNIDFGYGAGLGTTSGYSDVIMADLNGDQRPEIISPGYNAATLSIYTNNSTPGTISIAAPFTIPAVVSYTVQIVAADFDADNKTDLAWSVYGSSSVYFTKNLYSGGAFDATAFGSTISIPNTLANPGGIAAGDINADGKTDVIMSGSADMGMLQNIGTPGSLSSNSFLPTVVVQGSVSSTFLYLTGPVVADFDGDNKPDVAMVSTNNNPGENGVYLYRNQCYPAPQVTSVTPATAAAGATVTLGGNLMRTGSTDPVVTIGNIQGTISGTPGNASTQITVPAFAASGKVAVTNHGLTGFGKPLSVSFNTLQTIDATSFGSSVDFALGLSPRDALDVGDLNNDGKPEVIFADTNGAGIFQNAGTAGQSVGSSTLTKLATTFSAGISVLAMDIDGDTKTDLSTAFLLARNISTGSTITFDPGVNSGVSGYTGIAKADFNKDGKVDVAWTYSFSAVAVTENLSTSGAFAPNGNFTPFSSTNYYFTRPGTYGGVVAEDFDGDGYEDIICTNQFTSDLTYYLNAARRGPINSSSFNFLGNYSSSGSQPSWVAAQDFDGDGKVDIAVSYSNSAFVSVYRNMSVTGDISFAAPVDLPSASKGYRIAAQDLNGDGRAEIVVIHQLSPGPGSVTVFKNNSTSGAISFGTGVSFALTRTPQALALADVNGDNKPEILIIGNSGATAPANALMVLENKMTGPVISVTTQPASNYLVCEGATPTLTTAATGTTNITYQWQFSTDGVAPYTDVVNGAGYTNGSTATLTVNTAGLFGAGKYRCKISGDFATTVYSTVVTFGVAALPAPPLAADVSRCGTGTVLLTATGGTPGSYFWYDQGGLIAGQNNATYTTPSVATTTAYQVSVTDGTCVSTKTSVQAIVNATPTPPTATDVTICQPAQVTLTAAGGAAGEYRWYNAANVLQAGETAATYHTPTNELTTVYYVALSNGTCESAKTTVTVTLSPGSLPAPVVTTVPAAVAGTVTICQGQSASLSGPNGFTYAWSTTATTQQITINTNADITLIVSDANGCTSAPTNVAVVVNPCNNPPVINTTVTSTTIDGTATVDLTPLISDPDNNLDLSSLKVVVQPTSGATATINGQHQLIIDYKGVSFAGVDKLTVEVCDLSGSCTQQQIEIDVSGDIVVYNGFSPNGDSKNPVFVIANIDKLTETKSNHVTIYDRWGDAVFETDDYDNVNHVFRGLNKNGNELPPGTYFYKIEFASGKKPATGYLSLKR